MCVVHKATFHGLQLQGGAACLQLQDLKAFERETNALVTGVVVSVGTEDHLAGGAVADVFNVLGIDVLAEAVPKLWCRTL